MEAQEGHASAKALLDAGTRVPNQLFVLFQQHGKAEKVEVEPEAGALRHIPSNQGRLAEDGITKAKVRPGTEEEEGAAEAQGDSTGIRRLRSSRDENRR